MVVEEWEEIPGDGPASEQVKCIFSAVGCLSLAPSESGLFSFGSLLPCTTFRRWRVT